MTSKTKQQKNDKIKRVIDLLKFAASLEDEEILRSTVESSIELLEEISK